MDTKEQAPPLSSPAEPPRPRRFNLPKYVLLIGGLAAGSAALVVYSFCGPNTVPAQPEKKDAVGAAWSYEEVFPNWPKDRKPDFVIVLTGQTDGYLQKCGCSDPQKGGLERRFNFINGFKAHGIKEVIPLDVGDVAPHPDVKLWHDQALLKYATTMQAMKEMGYRAAGLGASDFELGLEKALGAFSLQPGNEQPRILAANLLGYKVEDKVMPKAVYFSRTGMPDGAMIHDWDVIPTASKLSVGVIGIVGLPTINAAKMIDPKLVFAEPPGPNAPVVIQKCLDEMKKQQPSLTALLYFGPPELAHKVANAFPALDLVVCPSDDASFVPAPSPNPKTMIVHVGHKGQDVGVVGIFKDAKGGFEKYYQRVTLSPEFETPEGQESRNAALKELENYSKAVRDNHFLAKNRKSPHALQVTNPNAVYVGTEKCLTCHNTPATDNSGQVWAASKHAHAYQSLVAAKKPSLRQFDGECIRCHTVGYDYLSGFVDEVKTPQLLNVGCENCHGPGSEHAADPKNKVLALQLSPWKVNGAGQLPSIEKMTAYVEEHDQAKKQKILTEMETRIRNNVDQTLCQTCHTSETDPHFKIESFWPKIAHPKMQVAKGNGPVPNGKPLEQPPPHPLPPPPVPLPEGQPLPKS